MTSSWPADEMRKHYAAITRRLAYLPPQYSPAEPRLATVDVDFACYKQKEMQIKGNFPFSHGQRTWHSTRNTALWLDIHGLPYIITNHPIEKIRNENNLLQIKCYITSNSWHYSCPRSVYCGSIVFLLVV